MARRRRIDARCDDGGGLLDERAGLEGDTRERSNVSRTQGFTRGDGAGQHHRAFSTLGIFVLMGVGGFSTRVLRGSVVVCHRGSAGPWIIDPPVAQRIAATWDQERARKARRASKRCMEQDASEGGWGQGLPVAAGGRLATATPQPGGFSIWLVGGGIKSGMPCGAAADSGFKAVGNSVHIHDRHATILYLMEHQPRQAGLRLQVVGVSG